MERFTGKHMDIINSEEFGNKVCLFCGYWKINDCTSNPASLYLFGDNDIGHGMGGQAIIRNCKNSMGIPTKKYPSYDTKSYYTDAEYDTNCTKIVNAIIKIIDTSEKYDEIVFPSDGFGTGLAKLKTKAPKTFEFMNKIIFDCFGIDYDDILKNGMQLTVVPNNSTSVELSKNV